MIWKDKHIEVDPPKRMKKLTGTRFAAVFGANRWKTPFQVWCECTRTYEPPFEDTPSTIAGKIIEPKQAEFMKTAYGMHTIVSPTDLYGKDYFKQTRGDFFPQVRIFGGMWDYLVYDADNGSLDMVLEMKTTKRSEDWANDIPEYYALQAALYAYFLGVDDVCMVATMLDEKDIANPDAVEVTVENTFVRPFKVSERYPDFPERVEAATRWWCDHVETGISPDWDEKADAEWLAALRKNNVNPDTDAQALMKEAADLQAQLAAFEAQTKPLTDRLDAIKKQLKTLLQAQFREGDKKVETSGSGYVWTLSRTDSMKVDDALLKQDGLYEKYAKPTTTYRMTVAKEKE